MANKIEQIDDRIFMCRSGSAADTQKIGNIIRAQLNQFQYWFFSFVLYVELFMDWSLLYEMLQNLLKVSFTSIKTVYKLALL